MNIMLDLELLLPSIAGPEVAGEAVIDVLEASIMIRDGDIAREPEILHQRNLEFATGADTRILSIVPPGLTSDRMIVLSQRGSKREFSRNYQNSGSCARNHGGRRSGFSRGRVSAW